MRILSSLLLLCLVFGVSGRSHYTNGKRYLQRYREKKRSLIETEEPEFSIAKRISRSLERHTRKMPDKCLDAFSHAKKEYARMESRGTVITTKYIPSCTVGGDWHGKQCAQRSEEGFDIQFCWCVDKDGTKQANSHRTFKSAGAAMTCGKTSEGGDSSIEKDQLDKTTASLCENHRKVEEPKVKNNDGTFWLPTCNKEDGTYTAVQKSVDGNWWWCMTPNGQAISESYRAAQEELDCSDFFQKDPRKGYKSKANKSVCEKEHEQSLSNIEKYDNFRGREILAEWIPKCDEDGRYEKIQCSYGEDLKPKVCWCVNFLGTFHVNTFTLGEKPSECPDYHQVKKSGQDDEINEAELRGLLEKLLED